MKKERYPLLSVIVPVYNVKPFLRKCVESIGAQTYPNIELILVDDGSTDGSGELCEELVREAAQSAIRLIHKPNGGQSSARNRGLSAASGELVSYVDSDDWLEPEAYAHSIELLLAKDADVVQFDYAMAWSEDRKQDKKEEQFITLEGKDILQYYMVTTTIITGSYSMCRVVCRRELLEGLLFREGKINEDIDFKYRMLARAKRLVVTNQQYYYYRQGNVTTSLGGLKRKDFDLRDAADALYELAKNESFGSIRFLAEVKRARTAFSLLCKIAYFGIADPTIDYKNTVKQLTREHRHNLSILLKAPLPLSRKLCAILLAIHIDCLKWSLRILKK